MWYCLIFGYKLKSSLAYDDPHNRSATHDGFSGLLMGFVLESIIFCIELSLCSGLGLTYCCDDKLFVHKYHSNKCSIDSELQKSEELLNDVLGVVKVHSDYKINLIKDVQNALGGIKPGDKLVVIRVNDGCFIKKRQIKE